MPPLLDRRFGIQLATTNGATTKWQLATCWQSVLVCFVWYPCMLALGRFFMTWGFSLCPILRPFNGISSSLLPLLRLLYSYYIICDPNRKCYSSMSGASADYLPRHLLFNYFYYWCFIFHFYFTFFHSSCDWVLDWKSKSANLFKQLVRMLDTQRFWPLANLHS